MLLISENEVINPGTYLDSFASIVAKLTSLAGGEFLAKVFYARRSGQAFTESEVRGISLQPLTRIVVARFESVEQLQQWWNSIERQQMWKIGMRYAQFCDIAVAPNIIPVRLPLSVCKEGLEKVGPFPHCAGPELFGKRERKAPDAAILRELGLSARESEVLSWIAQGKTNGEIAAILKLNTATVKKHVVHIFEKLGVETRVAAAVLAMETCFLHEKKQWLLASKLLP